MEADWRQNPAKYSGTLWKYYEDRFIDVGGIRTRYWDEGRGEETLLFIHGYTGSVEEWAWNIPDMEKRYRVLALDCPGFGLSDKPDTNYTYDFFAEHVSGFLQGLNIKRAHVISHSMGGVISLNLALRHQDLFRSLVLVAPGFARKFPFAMRLITVPLVGEALLKPAKDLAALEASFRHLTCEPTRYAEETLKRYHRFQQAPGYFPILLKFMRNYLSLFGITKLAKRMERSLINGLPRLEFPVLLIWGPQDKVVGFKASRRLRDLLPHAEFWSPNPCGHCPTFEYPQEFNARVMDFLARNGENR